MSTKIQIPDLGVDSAEVIEILVAAGDTISKEQGLVTIESDKASMEIPSPVAGTLVNLLVKVGDTVSEGTDLAEMSGDDVEDNPEAVVPSVAAQDVSSDETQQAATSPGSSQAAELVPTSGSVDVVVPDIGVDSATVIELLVQPGDTVESEQGLLLMESDKASMELPSPFAGTFVAFKVDVGANVSEGAVVASIETSQENTAPQPEAEQTQSTTTQSTTAQAATPQASPVPVAQAAVDVPASNAQVHAGPSVRKLAREFGVDLGQVTGTGVKGRVLKDDVSCYVKTRLSDAASASAGGGVSMASRPLPRGFDYTAFGEVRTSPMTRLHQLTADAMTESWLSVPRVTQFDEADVTELEIFRKETNNDPVNQEQGIRLTLLAFLVQASVRALQQFPQCNVSVDGHNIIQKNYYNIGIAVDTPAGLMVPVIKQADSKSLSVIAAEIRLLAGKARDKKISPTDLQGGCFSISSLGGVGGTIFTPVVNYPEVAIMGVGNSSMQPVWNGQEFIPRLICPLSLSYDHRAVNGADAARFLSYLATLVSDVRKLLL